MGWRYDPILVDEEHPVGWHIAEFGKMAETLSGYTNTCVISFIDLYSKVRRNFPEAREVCHEDRLAIGKAFIEIARRYDITIRPCAEGKELEPYGADCSGCMTVKTYEKALHANLDVPRRGTNQRNGECACLLGTDIGAYDTCGHLCRYCYANVHADLVRENLRRHDPRSPFLTGGELPGDVIHVAAQKSWVDHQLRLEFV
jgi:hypothetical protein